MTSSRSASHPLEVPHRSRFSPDPKCSTSSVSLLCFLLKAGGEVVFQFLNINLIFYLHVERATAASSDTVPPFPAPFISLPLPNPFPSSPQHTLYSLPPKQLPKWATLGVGGQEESGHRNSTRDRGLLFERWMTITGFMWLPGEVTSAIPEI